MLPQGLRVVDESSTVEMPSRTYKLDFERRRIDGYVDSMEAVAQAIQKIFETERYAWEIYSQNYGIELETLIGQQVDFVIAVLENRVKEALLADDRIQGVENFVITQTSKTVLTVECIVITSQGTLEVRKELNL